MTKTSVNRFFLGLLGAGLPLVVGLLGLVALIVDLFGPFDLPNGYGDEILIAAASVVLLAYFAQHRLQKSYDKRHEELLTQVEVILGRIQDRLEPVRQVPAGDIKNLLKSHVVGAKEYLFRGGSGRWLRSFTMPELSNATDRDVRLTIELLDPRDEGLCAAYASYRAKALPSGHVRDNEDARLIQRDILGSIYAAAWYSARRRMEAKVILLRSFSPLRYDVSSEGLMLTVAELTEPGLYAAPGTWLHSSVVDELHQASHGHVVVVLPGLAECNFPQALESVTADDVRMVLSAATVKGASEETSLLDRFAAESVVDWERVATDHVRN
ncbi:hypothetical protein ACFCV3_22030 [Kribbella sp. NPDC056345]|uniref:hypothetical protein n=1 Tax=Kribbella sp. NPDC056345 TaxID=3345789 RepID=UPI0035D55013